MNFEKYGKEFLDILFKSDKLSWYIGDYWNEDRFLNVKLQKMSLIHINFEESKVWTVTKDAKITVPDMIGNIGGTLGVFIGFSFLGLLDTLTEWMEYIQRKLKCLKP